MIKGGFGFTHDVESGLSRKWVIGSDGVKRWHDNGDPVEPTVKESLTVDGDIPIHLRNLSEHMKDVATRMDYYGGFDGEVKAKAKELLGAARMAEEWADCIELEDENK